MVLGNERVYKYKDIFNYFMVPPSLERRNPDSRNAFDWPRHFKNNSLSTGAANLKNNKFTYRYVSRQTVMNFIKFKFTLWIGDKMFYV